MSLKLDAIFSRTNNYALTAPTEAPIGPSGKSQAGSECTPHNSANTGLISTTEHVHSEALCVLCGWRLEQMCV